MTAPVYAAFFIRMSSYCYYIGKDCAELHPDRKNLSGYPEGG